LAYPDIDPGLYLDLGRDQLAAQLGAADAVDAKSGTWFAVGSTLAGLEAALIALKHPTAAWPIILAVCAAIAYATMTVTAMAGFLSPHWAVGPKVGDLEDARRRNGWDEVQTRWVTARMYRDAWNENREPYRVRLVELRTMAISLALQTLLLGALAVALAVS
jgi:hypothetical protein